MAVIAQPKILNLRKLNSTDLELAVAHRFDFRRNLIVPNVWWGLGFKHEIDVLVLTGSNFAYEIEIKISKQDLKKDFEKTHGHLSNRLRKQYFAVTENLRELALELIVSRRPNWGLIVVNSQKESEKVREAKVNKSAIPFPDKDRQHLYQLASMRTWTLKSVLADTRSFERKNLNTDPLS